MDKLPLYKILLVLFESGNMDNKQYAELVTLVTDDDDFASTALIVLEKRLNERDTH